MCLLPMDTIFLKCEQIILELAEVLLRTEESSIDSVNSFFLHKRNLEG
jgi:hypothetical protein